MRSWLAIAFLFLATPALATPPAKARTTRPSKDHVARPTPRERFPSISIFGAHVGEALTYRPFDEKGRVRKDAARSLEKLLRCRQTGARHRLHPRLGDALYLIGRHFAGHRVEIYSGYRPRAFCNREHSRHMTGSAVDFHIEGVPNDTLIAYLKKTFHPAGVGFYPRGVHVHLDLERSNDTYWVDGGPPASDPSIVAPMSPASSEEAVLPHDTAPLPLPPEAEVAEAVELPAAPLGEPPSDDPGVADPLPAAPDPDSSN